MPRSNIGPETHEFVEWLDIIQGRIDFILNGQGQLRSQGQNRFFASNSVVESRDEN